MIKNLFLISLSVLLSSCFSYYDKAERLAVMGIIDSDNDRKNNYDLGETLDYTLVYRFNGDTADVPILLMVEKDENGAVQKVIKRFFRGFCNVVFPAMDVFGCGYILRGKVNVEVFLKSVVTGHSILLAKKTIDMDAYYRSVLLTQVYLGTDTAKYRNRLNFNIDWSKMKPIVFEGANDTLYHYTAWYWDKREKYENNLIEDRFFVEIP
ncbi:hypothetical protein [Fibrobacter succinogenes]|uniref:hypothetical protein n=1 Tax=Fibrobacter succinogenes TaxID=833 RepID=UPI00156A54DB|nr:hypothetical protein [Fibrobacter succinogenes]